MEAKTLKFKHLSATAGDLKPEMKFIGLYFKRRSEVFIAEFQTDLQQGSNTDLIPVELTVKSFPEHFGGYYRISVRYNHPIADYPMNDKISSGRDLLLTLIEN